MNNKALQNPVVFTKRADIREAIKSELVKIGAEKVIVVSTSDECIHELFQERERILCLDWAVGDEESVKVLEAVRGKFLIETRPVYVLIPEVSENTVATALEYGVSRIHSGAVSGDEIRVGLKEIIKEGAVQMELNQTLITVAQARLKGEWIESTVLLQDLYEKNPSNARIVTEYAENLVHEGNWVKAQQILAPLIAGDETPVRALHLMGRCYLKQGDLDAAIGQLERAKIINPLNVDRLIELGTAYLGTDNIERAMENFSEANRLAGDNAEAKAGLGKCHMMVGEVNEALALLKEHSGPRELASIFNTAAILSIRGDRFLKGMALYQAAISATKGDKKVAARLVFNMGIGYKRQGDLQKARACFAKSAQWDPGFEKAARCQQLAEKKLAQMGQALGPIEEIVIGVSLAEAFGRPGTDGDSEEQQDYVSVGEDSRELSAEGDLSDFDDDLGAA